MTGDFLNIAGALSGEEFAALARALLDRLEGRNAPRSPETEPEERAPESAILAAAERLATAAEKLGARAEPPAAASGFKAAPKTEAADSRIDFGAGTAGSPAGKTGSVPSGADGMSGRSSSAAAESGGKSMDLEKLSESIRRDARRCDSGFERY